MPSSSVSVRQALLLRITRKLVYFTAGSLLLITAFQHFMTSQTGADGASARTYILPIIFGAGLVGGFVSIQQRLPKIGELELQELSGSWSSILLIPLNGGIFAIVLHLAFQGEILQGDLFPKYVSDSAENLTGVQTLAKWMKTTRPDTLHDLAKMVFWGFVAGFSERFVPQIIGKTTQQAHGKDDDSAG